MHRADHRYAKLDIVLETQLFWVNKMIDPSLIEHNSACLIYVTPRSTDFV